MRKRVPITLAAGGRWPAADGGLGVCFNWVKLDNRGSNAVDFALSATPTAGDKTDTLLTVGAGKVRIFNVAGPKGGDEQEDWPDALFLTSTSGTSLVLEVADHPIVDMVFAT